MLERFNNVVSSLLDERTGENDVAAHSLQFSYEDLAIATSYFTSKNLIGSGSAGVVYRGCLHGCTEVAVKVLNCASGLESFATEVTLLSRFRHPNLVMLLGWGQHVLKETKFLVYELLPGGSIGRRLYRCKLGHEPFHWEHRLRAAFNAACGLSYMVNSQPKAFHRDIKVSNILLDANGIAKMSDFGLASTTADSMQSRINVDDISGTPGYLCPEYVQTGEVTERSEVYAFGVVLLELLTNELPAKIGPQGEITYPLMISLKPWEFGSLDRLVASLDSSARWPRPLADDVATLALRCVRSSGVERPSFATIVIELRRLCQSAAEVPNCSIARAAPPGFSNIPPSGPHCFPAAMSRQAGIIATLVSTNLLPKSQPPEPQPPEPSFFTLACQVVLGSSNAIAAPVLSPPPSPKPKQPTPTLAPVSTPSRWVDSVTTAARPITQPPLLVPAPLPPESPRPGLGFGSVSSQPPNLDQEAFRVPKGARLQDPFARRGASCSGPRVLHQKDPLSPPRVQEPIDMEWTMASEKRIQPLPSLSCDNGVGKVAKRTVA